MNVTSMSDLRINIKIFPISITVPPPNFEFGFFWFSLAAFYDVFGFFRLRPPGNPGIATSEQNRRAYSFKSVQIEKIMNLFVHKILAKGIARLV